MTGIGKGWGWGQWRWQGGAAKIEASERIFSNGEKFFFDVTESVDEGWLKGQL